MTNAFPWWYPVGANVQHGGTAFRLWADSHQKVSVVLRNDEEHPLLPEGDGYFSVCLPNVSAGDKYQFRVDGSDALPDPASRFQPEGPHGPSQVISPDLFAWTDSSWQGVKLSGQIIYELHVGTFTKEGSWQAASRELPALADLGITLIEVMPVGEFAGRFGWGYDGVDLFAPTRNYGSPDDFRSFVNAAHANNIGVILDVVYNHLGPDGNYLTAYSENYFTKDHQTDWGAAINFYGEQSAHVRQFYCANAAYWIKEFHLDGLRLDATQNIYDKSEDHIIASLTRSARRAAESRNILVVGENEPQEVKLIRPRCKDGYSLDALWNDDFHHSTIVAATGQRGAYYTDYYGSSQELLSSLKYGFLYQGQRYSWQKHRRGTNTFPTNPQAMINFLQNHDQIANSARGRRLHELTTFGRYKALTAITLLGPATPMLFQGQEFSSSAPFLFFADHTDKLAEMVRKGRAEFLAQWKNLAQGNIAFDDPSDPSTFEKCKLSFSERNTNAHIYNLHKDLLALRKAEPLFRRQDRNFDGAVLAPEAFVVRFFSDDYKDDRLFLVNLGVELDLSPAPVPLLGPPEKSKWTVLWSSEDPRYGGNDTPALDSDSNWVLPGHAAVVLKPVAVDAEVDRT